MFCLCERARFAASVLKSRVMGRAARGAPDTENPTTAAECVRRWGAARVEVILR